MTCKEFLKSKTLKCILVLLCIALVSGALLSIMNDLLKVSDEERVMRTIKSIYGEEIGYTEVIADYSTEEGKIENVFRLADDNYLIKSTGFDGYQKGTVSVWLVAEFEADSYKGINNVSIADYEKQTLMSKFNDNVLKKFSGSGKEGFDVVVSGATLSSRALNNAVNTAVSYISENLVKETGGAE